MVSFWPWKAEDTSPASFERILSSLATRITAKSTQLSSLRQRSRRFKALWTLYTTFAYLLYALILSLVVGWHKWGVLEAGGLLGGPLVIYLVRLLLSTYYDYRTSRAGEQLQGLQEERAKTIEKLKAATKYNSTQMLLERYGGDSPSSQMSSPSPSGHRHKGKSESESRSPSDLKNRGVGRSQQRVGFVPPPTANIPRNQPPQSLPSTPQQGSSTPVKGSLGDTDGFPAPLGGTLHGPAPGSPTFTPPTVSHPAPPEHLSRSEISDGIVQSKWYDRILDLLLGEDETLPRNRLALVCKHCKLVNGQAPPGVKRLEDVGKWKCGGCGGWNGDEADVSGLIEEAQKQAAAEAETAKFEKENESTDGNEEGQSESEAGDWSGNDDDSPESPAPSPKHDLRGKKKGVKSSKSRSSGSRTRGTRSKASN